MAMIEAITAFAYSSNMSLLGWMLPHWTSKYTRGFAGLFVLPISSPCNGKSNEKHKEEADIRERMRENESVSSIYEQSGRKIRRQ
jgi:hypothetical protein